MAVLISSTQINKNKNNMKLTINGIQREVVANEGESLLESYAIMVILVSNMVVEMEPVGSVLF